MSCPVRKGATTVVFFEPVEPSKPTRTARALLQKAKAAGYKFRISKAGGLAVSAESAALTNDRMEKIEAELGALIALVKESNDSPNATDPT